MSFVTDALFGSTPTISAPEKRDYLQELQSALNAQSSIQPQLLGLERQYTPQYQDLQRTSLMGQLGNLDYLYQNAGDISQRLQGQYAGMQMPIYNQLGQMANQAYQQGLGSQTMGLYNTINQQAQAGLDAGYGLTPEMQMQAQQSARAAMSARGLTGGNQGVAQEVLNSYNLGNTRYQQALQNAQGAYNLGVGQFGNAMNAYGAPVMQQMQSINPTSLLGQSAAGYQSLGARIFQPESQYNAGIIGANISNEMQTNMANAQIASADRAANMGFVGSLISSGGSYAGSSKIAEAMCWVAREVYGTKTNEWIVFRDWLTFEAPKWLYNLYKKYGESFAVFISNKPKIKSLIKLLMNKVVVSRLNK